jgi:hypothetical protein
VAAASYAGFPAGAAEPVFKTLDRALQHFFGFRVAGTQASTGFAHSYGFYTSRFPAHADCPVLGWCCEVAPIYWIAPVFGAVILVETPRGREVARRVHVVARVIGACVVVFAHDTFAKVLSALAGHTDAGNAIEGAVRSVDHWTTHTLRSAPETKTLAILVRAFVAVVWAPDVYTRLGLAPH